MILTKLYLSHISGERYLLFTTSNDAAFKYQHVCPLEELKRNKRVGLGSFEYICQYCNRYGQKDICGCSANDIVAAAVLTCMIDDLGIDYETSFNREVFKALAAILRSEATDEEAMIDVLAYLSKNRENHG